MKTAIAQLIEKVESDSLANYTYEEVLEMLSNAEVTQDAQIKIAYLHGGMDVIQNKDIKSEDYFINEFSK